MYNIREQVREEFHAGQKEIYRASLAGKLTSQEQIDAHAMWRTIAFLRTRFEEEPICIDDVSPEDIIRWVQ